MNKKNISTKVFVLLLAVMLLLGCTVGGTVAYLMNKSATVINTFSTSNIQIELKETTGNDYKLVPGKTYAKDPTVTVLGTTDVDCYLFVKIEEKDWSDFLQYAVNDSGWEYISNANGIVILGRAVGVGDAVKSWKLLVGETGYPDGCIKVSSNLTLAEMADAAKAELSFTAYAIQQEGFASAADAWAVAQNLDK